MFVCQCACSNVYSNKTQAGTYTIILRVVLTNLHVGACSERSMYNSVYVVTYCPCFSLYMYASIHCGIQLHRMRLRKCLRVVVFVAYSSSIPGKVISFPQCIKIRLLTYAVVLVIPVSEVYTYYDTIQLYYYIRYNVVAC